MYTFRYSQRVDCKISANGRTYNESIRGLASIARTIETNTLNIHIAITQSDMNQINAISILH